MPELDETKAMISELEASAELPSGLLGNLLSLEERYPDLNARGERRNLYRDIAEMMDAAADGAAK